MFSISRQVVQGMITGEYPNARAAFDAFNAAMAAGAPMVRNRSSAAVYAPSRMFPAIFTDWPIKNRAPTSSRRVFITADAAGLREAGGTNGLYHPLLSIDERRRTG